MQEKLHIQNRIIDPKDFLEKRFRPSLQSHYAFAKIFTAIFSDFGEKIEIKSVEWNKEKLAITFTEKKSGEILYSEFRDNFGNKKCNSLLCSNNLCCGVHYEVGNENFLQFLVHFLVKGENFTLETFLQILAKDIKAKKEYYSIFHKPLRGAFSVIQDWAHPLQKVRFIVNEGFVRNADQSLNLDLPNISIHHSERECQGITPNNKEKGYHFFNFPKSYYGNKINNKYYYLTEEEKQTYLQETNNGHSMGISTDLDENDIVMGGGTDKLSNAIEYAIQNIEKNNIKTISFNCCCVPRIVGDDIYSVLERAKNKIKIPFIFHGQLEKTPYEQKVLLLEDYLDKIDKSAISKIPHSFSLFGFDESEYQIELSKILIKSGLKLNSSFIPSIDVRLLEMMYKSKLFVFSPNNFQKEAFEYPFQAIGTKFISPKYPYGLKNSCDWLLHILQNFDKKLVLDEKLEQIIGEYQSKISYVKAKKYRILISFLGIPDLKKFFNPDYTSNVDIIEFLEEMGFGIDFVVYDNFDQFVTKTDDSFQIADGDNEKIKILIENKVKNKSNSQIILYSDLGEFENMVKNSESQIVYSDIYFDSRISNIGKTQCNIKNFYPGIHGALQTITELIQLSEMNFYTNFAKYFSK